MRPRPNHNLLTTVGSTLLRMGAVSSGFDPSESEGGGGGVPSSGQCCCNERRCIKIPGYSGPFTGLRYRFWPQLMDCDCDGADKLEVFLEETEDPTIYESDPIQCVGGSGEALCTNVGTWRWKGPCTNVGTWTWTRTSPCTNTKTWFALWPSCLGSGGCSFISVSDGGGGFMWVVDDDSQCLEGCECAYNDDEVPVGAGEYGAGQCTPSPATLAWVALSGDGDDPSCCSAPYPSLTPTTWGQTTTTDCEVGEEIWAWVLTSETNAACGGPPPYPEEDGTVEDETTTTTFERLESSWNLYSQTLEGCCTPDEPDYEGTEEDQEATTECTAETSLGDSFWRLTIGSVGYYGCDSTKLEFLIDGEVIFTYYLNCPSGEHSRPWCPECVNTFHITTCGASRCTYDPPTIICLTPDLSPTVDPGEGWGCCITDEDGEIPRFYLVDLAMTANPGLAYPMPCCATTASGRFLLEWDAGVVGWVAILNADNCAGDCEDDPEVGLRTLTRLVLRCEGSGEWSLILYGIVYGPCDEGTMTCLGGDGSCVTIGSEYEVNHWIGEIESDDCFDPLGIEMSNTSAGCIGASNPTVYPVLTIPI